MEKKYWLKIDKDRIKLQLKGLGKRFSLKRTNSRTIIILVLFFLLVGIIIGVYNNYPDNYEIEDKAQVLIEPIIPHNNNIKPNEYSLRPHEEIDELVNDNIFPHIEDDDVVTEPVKRVEKIVNQEFTLLRPVSGEIIQNAGWYYHSVLNDWRYQRGIEFNGKIGDIVMAAASGKVLSVKEDEYLGIVVIISHENGWQTEYGHLQKASVSPDETVFKGQEIGRMGITGMTSQPSLYFTLINKDGAIDPSEYFE